MKVPPIVIIVVSIAVSISNVCAGKKPTPTPTPRFGMTVIASINEHQIIVESSRSRKLFKITDQTKIYYLGQKATVSDLAPGMRVSVTPKFGQNSTADTIDAGNMSKAIEQKK